MLPSIKLFFNIFIPQETSESYGRAISGAQPLLLLHSTGYILYCS
jgi:hypothetical protein